MNDDITLAEIVDATPAERAEINQAYALQLFLNQVRTKLKYFINGMLPEAGKMLDSGAAKAHKTTLLIQKAMCLASGGCEYLNFTFNEAVSVLMCQPELSDSLLCQRINWISETAPQWLDLDRVHQNFHILENTHGRVSLWQAHPRCEQSKIELERAITRTGARVLLMDSLYMLFAGMDENKADQVTLALDYLADLINRFGVSIILTHHFNKSGTAARGSSVLQGWPETELTMTTLESEPTICRVDVLMRCAYPKGFPAYWRKPTEFDAWFEYLPDYEPESKFGRKAKVNDALIRLVLRDAGRALRHNELVSKVADAASCATSTAKQAVRKAREAGIILEGAGLYALPRN